MADTAYSQTGDYIPKTDNGFNSWILNFASLIQADPSRYGLTASDASVISNLQSSYTDLFNKVQSNATRTPQIVMQKDAVKASAAASCRVYAMQIKSNAGVTEDNKLALGIHVDDTTKTSIPAPTTAPLLSIVSAFSGEHIIRYADEATPASRKKAPGATQLELFVYVGPSPITDWTLASSVGVFTKNPINYTFTPDKANMTATYFARWRTARGLDGPMSLPIAMGIAFGGPVDSSIPTGGTSLSGGDELSLAA